MVSIKKWITGGLAAGMLAVAMAGTTPAWAGTTSAHLVAGHVAVRSDAAKPNSDITGSGATVKFTPTKLSAKWSGPTQKTCTATLESFKITNTAKVTETVTYKGAAFAKVPAGKVLGVCAWGTGTATAKFGLKANTKAALTVTVS